MDRLVLVVHGVGDPTPGETVRPLARALAVQSGQRLDPVQQVLWLPDEPIGPDGPNRQLEVFPCHVELIGSGEDASVRDRSWTMLAEVHWADISRVRGGVVGALQGFFSVVFGLRHVARSASDPNRQDAEADRGAVVLRWFSGLIAGLLRGPVAGTNVLLAAATLIAAAALTLFGTRNLAQPAAEVLVVFVGFAGLAVGSFFYLKGRGSGSAVFHLWVAISGLLYVLLPLGPHGLYGRMSRLTEYYDDRVFALTCRQHGFDLAFYGVLMIDLVNLAWVITAAAMLATLACWLWAWRRAAGTRYQAGIHAAQFANAATAGLWFLAVPTLWVVAYQKLPDSARVEGAMKLMNQGVPLMGFHWAGALILALVALLTLALRSRWSRRVRADEYRSAPPAPRLLVGEPLQAALIVASLVGSITILLLFIAAGHSDLGPFERVVDRFLHLFHEGNAIAFQVSILLGAVAVALLPYLRVGLDISLDVIDHFRREPDRPVQVLAERDPESAEPPPTPFVRRELIRRRLRTLLATLVEALEPGKLTILAHSQGTIAAIDVLAEGPDYLTQDPKRSCSLVTMGSPFSHLYQHYFPNDYPSLSDRRWIKLMRLVGDRWYNIFRIDDFVGTDIEPGGTSVDNLPVARGGHTGYWTDREVLKHLLGSKIDLLGGARTAENHR